MKKTIRVLCVDGGGVGGIIPARILERLYAEYPNLISNVDLFAGTSTGGLIALGLANGLSPTQLCDLYLAQAPEIFSSSYRRYQVEWPLRSKYLPTGLNSAVNAIVGTKKVGDVAGNILIPITGIRRPDGSHAPAGIFVSTAFRLIDGGSPHEKYQSSQWSCIDVAMSTSAAPTYFPAHAVTIPSSGHRWLCWDGGIVANNPALAAVGEVYRLALAEGGKDVRADHSEAPDIRVLSLGTGYKDTPLDAGDWGLLQCARPVISTLMDASVGSTAFLLRQLLGRRAVRISPPNFDYDIDDASALNRLDRSAQEFASRFLQAVQQPDGTQVDVRQWLEQNWQA